MVKIDKEVEVLEYSVVKMGSRVISMHETLQRLYVSKDRAQALELIKADSFINNMEEEINDIAISVFALLSPVASDLRRVITAIKIASELERIGDYAKNIASYIIRNDSIILRLRHILFKWKKRWLRC